MCLVILVVQIGTFPVRQVDARSPPSPHGNTVERTSLSSAPRIATAGPSINLGAGSVEVDGFYNRTFLITHVPTLHCAVLVSEAIQTAPHKTMLIELVNLVEHPITTKLGPHGNTIVGHQ